MCRFHSGTGSILGHDTTLHTVHCTVCRVCSTHYVQYSNPYCTQLSKYDMYICNLELMVVFTQYYNTCIIINSSIHSFNSGFLKLLSIDWYTRQCPPDTVRYIRKSPKSILKSMSTVKIELLRQNCDVL